MRTVHETEALRPSDPIPKSQHGGSGGKSSKLKIIIKTPQSHATGQDDSVDDGADGNDSEKEQFTPLHEDLFTEKELGYPLKELHARCRYQVKLADEESERLATDIKKEEEEYRRMWREKELLISQVLQGEMDWHERREAIKSGAVNIKLAGGHEEDPDESHVNGVTNGDATAIAVEE